LADQSRRTRAAGPAGAAFALPATVSHAALLEADGDAAFRQVLYLMVTAFGRLETCRDAFGRSVGLTGSQFAVLIGTAYTQGEAGVTISQLSEHVQLASTHVTTEVGRLCRRGLLQKSLNPDDRRSVLVRLTPRGEQHLLELAPFVRTINDMLFAGIDREQFLQLGAFLARFVGNTETAVAEIRRLELMRSRRGAGTGPKVGTKPGRRAEP
jgi:MarR family transcriptional regulator, organic hydroperoxide resistance regulator